MNMINICFLDEYSLNGTDISAIKALGNYTGWKNTYPEQVVDRAAEAEVIITNKVKITAEIMRSLPHLKLICVAATGMNNVDLDAAADLGITVKNAVGYSTESVTEATFAAVLTLLRQTIYYDAYVKSGKWSTAERLFHFGYQTRLVDKKRWGIIGLGNIGRRVAEIASAFGAEIFCCSPSETQYETTYKQLSLEELLATCDIVSIHTPLNQHSANMIGSKELSLMKQTALLVNMARGGIVDEAALAQCLNEGKIAGAATDVFGREPVEGESPLLKVNDPNKLVLSPHNAWASDASIARLAECIVANIKQFYNI